MVTQRLHRRFFVGCNWLHLAVFGRSGNAAIVDYRYKMSRSSRIDWDYWRYEYVSGDDSVTFEVLSERPNAPNVATLKRHSAKESWVEQRKQFRRQSTTKMVESATTQDALRRIEQLVDQVEAITRHLKLSRALQGTAAKALQTVDPSRLHPRDMLAMMTQGVQMERLAMEMATARVALDGKLDLTAMSDEQLERLANGEDPQKVIGNE